MPKKTSKTQLVSKAKAVLEKNWHRGYTVPSWDLYPAQWSWDSAFHALGWAHIDINRSWEEMKTLFNYQWDNGMVPHIVFHNATHRDKYFPDVTYWDTGRSTSALIQPPFHATACWHLYERATNKRLAKKILIDLFPHLLAWHRYLLEYRDPENSGLLTIFHPWESGFDNSPRWDEVLQQIQIDQMLLPAYERVDLKRVEDPTSRPTNEEYDKFIYLVELYRQVNFQAKEFYQQSPFLVKDVVANSLFYKANLDLRKISFIVREDDSEIRDWIAKIEENFLPYFCPDPEGEGLLYDFDLRKNSFIYRRTGASLVPLYTGLLSPQRADRLRRWLSHAHFCGEDNCKLPLVPSTAIEQLGFQQVTYWRGPVWINVNWLIYKGLQTYGFKKEAELIAESVISLIAEYGFYEYYDPFTGQGLGAKDFSWTAALLIDFVEG